MDAAAKQSIQAGVQWIAACAERLGDRWGRLAPDQLVETASRLWCDEVYRAMDPCQAAEQWLHPVSRTGESAPF